jgi:hypothetical protein
MPFCFAFEVEYACFNICQVPAYERSLVTAIMSSLAFEKKESATRTDVIFALCYPITRKGFKQNDPIQASSWLPHPCAEEKAEFVYTTALVCIDFRGCTKAGHTNCKSTINEDHLEGLSTRYGRQISALMDELLRSNDC